MHWNGEITLGNLIQIFVLLGGGMAAWYGLTARITVFQELLKTHTKSLSDHAGRLDRHETRILELVGGLQRLMGQTEIAFRYPQRREGDDGSRS